MRLAQSKESLHALQQESSYAQSKARYCIDFSTDKEASNDINLEVIRDKTFDLVSKDLYVSIADKPCRLYTRKFGNRVNESDFDEHIIIPSRQELGLPSEADDQRKYIVKISQNSYRDGDGNRRFYLKTKFKNPEGKKKIMASTAFRCDNSDATQGKVLAKATEIEGFFEVYRDLNKSKQNCEVSIENVSDCNLRRRANRLRKLGGQNLSLHEDLDNIVRKLGIDEGADDSPGKKIKISAL